MYFSANKLYYDLAGNYFFQNRQIDMQRQFGFQFVRKKTQRRVYIAASLNTSPSTNRQHAQKNMFLVLSRVCAEREIGINQSFNFDVSTRVPIYLRHWVSNKTF